jgi:hypothetical protein
MLEITLSTPFEINRRAFRDIPAEPLAECLGIIREDLGIS